MLASSKGTQLRLVGIIGMPAMPLQGLSTASRAVGDLDPAVTVLLTDRDAGTELFAGRPHMAAQIVGVSQSAQG